MRNQRELADKGEFLYELFEHLDDVFWLASAAHLGLHYVSPSVETMFGVSVDELYSNSVLLLSSIHPRDKEDVVERITSQRETNQFRHPFELICRILHTDGSIRHIWTRCFPSFDSNGEVRALAGLSTDISELIQTKEELARSCLCLERRVRENTAELEFANNELQQQIMQRAYIERAHRQSEANLRSLAENINDGILVILDERLVYANPRASTMLGYPLPTLLTLAPEKLFLCRDWKQHEKTRNTPALPWETEFCTADGRLLPVEVSMARAEWQGKDADFLVFRDITARKEAEAILRQTMKDLDHARQQLLAENIYLQERLQQHLTTEMIGLHGGLRAVHESIQLVAPIDTTVLLLGETGTGKELLAQLVHQTSLRKDKPFIKVNCAAIAESLVESEMFGHEKGAFTGATTERQGRFELADGGTIFLDEVGEMPLPVQAKLLRVLQDGEFERVGGSQTIRVNVRVIAATNRDLEEAVQQGHFRKDLFFRLHVFPIRIPALRDRKQDLPELVEYFVKHFSERMRRRIEIIPPEALHAFLQHSWPGNVRELKNVIERAVIWSKGPELSWQEALGNTPSDSKQTVERLSLEEVEKQHILNTLRITNWVIQGSDGAASILGLNPSTLRSKMKKLGLSRPK